MVGGERPGSKAEAIPDIGPKVMAVLDQHLGVILPLHILDRIEIGVILHTVASILPVLIRVLDLLLVINFLGILVVHIPPEIEGMVGLLRDLLEVGLHIGNGVQLHLLGGLILLVGLIEQGLILLDQLVFPVYGAGKTIPQVIVQNMSIGTGPRVAFAIECMLQRHTEIVVLRPIVSSQVVIRIIGVLIISRTTFIVIRWHIKLS